MSAGGSLDGSIDVGLEKIRAGPPIKPERVRPEPGAAVGIPAPLSPLTRLAIRCLGALACLMVVGCGLRFTYHRPTWAYTDEYLTEKKAECETYGGIWVQNNPKYPYRCKWPRNSGQKISYLEWLHEECESRGGYYVQAGDLSPIVGSLGSGCRGAHTPMSKDNVEKSLRWSLTGERPGGL